MVATPSVLVAYAFALAACSLSSVEAAPFALLPVSPLKPGAKISRRHPAFGGGDGTYAPDPIIKTPAQLTGHEEVAGVLDAELAAAHVTAKNDRQLEGFPALFGYTDVDKINEFLQFFDNSNVDVNAATLFDQYKSATRATKPWPGNYWASSADGINNRWDGLDTLSPVEKYAQAYGKDAKKIADAVSASAGVDLYRTQKGVQECSSTSECGGGGVVCSKRRGQDRGLCLPGWYGVCHAWATAALLEPEPRCNVVKNDVVFKPYDIKGLISQFFNENVAGSTQVGARYYGTASSDYKPGVDTYNRYNDDTRRDLGPGLFHIALTNIMGARGRGMIIEHDNTEAVWNQPILSYEILEMTDKSSYTFPKTVDGVTTNVEMEPDFGSYDFNRGAKKLKYTRTQVTWVEEAYVDGELATPERIGQYTHTKEYEYVLETDYDDNIVGGEWVGTSIHDHPDFLWWPTGGFETNTVSSDGLAYADIKELIDLSVACQSQKPTPTTPAPTTPAPTTPAPTTPAPTTPAPTTPTPTTPVPTTPAPTTATPEPSTGKPSGKPTEAPEPSSGKPTPAPEPSSGKPTPAPEPSSGKPTPAPEPSSGKPTPAPEPSSGKPTPAPEPSSGKPTPAPEPTTPQPTKPVPTTPAPTTPEPTKPVPTTPAPTTPEPTKPVPTTPAPTTPEPTKPVPTTPTPGSSCGSDKEGALPCPSGEYCQPWNPHYYQCRHIDTDKCGQQEVGVDFNGEDISTVEVQLPEQCCDKCRETKGCKAYTFVNYNADGKARCYLKSGVGKKQKLVGAVSAVVSAPECSVPSGGACGNDQSGPSCCPSGEYCQPWNPSFYQCRPAPKQCAAQEVGVDYAGDDLRTIEAIMPWECCDRCAETAGCKAYTFVNYNSNGKSACYLKSGTGKKQAKVGAVSSTVLNPKPVPQCSVPSAGQCGSEKAGVSCCPSGEYCQPWDPFYYQCRPAPKQCAAQEVGVDYVGDDIKTIESIMPWECCDRCAETYGCKAYTFVNYNSNGKSACYLKSGMGKKQNKAGAVSSTVLNPKQTKCALSLNVDFYGNDLRTELGLNVDQCCEKCHETKGCKGFTHVVESNRVVCYLKTSASGNKYYWGATSGVAY